MADITHFSRPHLWPAVYSFCHTLGTEDSSTMSAVMLKCTVKFCTTRLMAKVETRVYNTCSAFKTDCDELLMAKSFPLGVILPDRKVT